MRHLKPTGKKGTFVSEELYEEIWNDVCGWFDKNIDRWVANIRKIYELTGDWGYRCLEQNWGAKNRNLSFSDESIRENIIEKIYAPMNWLYIRNDYGQKPMEFSEGFSGLMITFRITVKKYRDTDEYKWSYSYELSIDISSGECKTIK